MTAPAKFNKNTLRGFGSEILKRIGKIDGVTVKLHGGNFDEKEFIMKIKFTLDDPHIESNTQKIYDVRRQTHGLPEWGFAFTDFDGGEWLMVDYKLKSPKYPIIAANSSGTEYKFSISHVLNCLANQGQPDDTK